MKKYKNGNQLKLRKKARLKLLQIMKSVFLGSSIDLCKGIEKTIY